MYFIKILMVYVLFLCKISWSVNDTDITIFDIGQGNCVLVNYRDESMLFDAGSTEQSFPALYNRLFSNNSKRYRVDDIIDFKDEETDDEIEEIVSLDEISEDEHKECIIDTEKDPNTDTPMEKQRMAEQIRCKLKNKVRAVVVSHPDRDHYNLLNLIFSPNCGKTIDSLILGGLKSKYESCEGDGEELIKWIDNNKWAGTNPANNTNKLIKQVLYTGTSNGAEDTATTTYARAYSSGYSAGINRTLFEAKIEEALHFSLVGTPPTIEILTMNVGHPQTPDGQVYVINDVDNTNSIVIRVKAQGSSFIITGDANEYSWNFIKAAYHSNLADLQKSYLLLCHHGTDSEGSNNKKMLDMLKPEACFISAGVNKAYAHPRSTVINSLIAADYLKSWEDDDISYIGYFEADEEEKIRKRKSTNKCIISTADNGTINFLLKPEWNISMTRDRKHAFEQNVDDLCFTRDGEGKRFSSFSVFKKAVKKEIKDKKKKQNLQKVVYFTKHSNNYNLILPEDGNEPPVDAECYLYDLTTNIGCKISRILP